jgi:uncharacterized protein YcbK (DUF882 family)
MIRDFLRVSAFRHALLFLGALVLVFPVTKIVAGSGVRTLLASPASMLRKAPPPKAELVNVPNARHADQMIALGDSLFGRSGQLLTRLLDQREALAMPGFASLFGEDALKRPGVLGVATDDDPAAFSFIVTRPWRDKRGSYVGAYHVGWWPAERTAMPANYDNPAGFIEVTPENQNTRLSTHFRLRDFVTHDQDRVWPKYVVLREDLLDKLELVLHGLEVQNVPVKHVQVLSGFRSPQYNAKGASEGMARASRHQFGDAADIIIDNDGDGRMDDLNRDGHVNFADTDVILRAVERVEKSHPDLVGGLGLYAEMGPTGPFAHIDVRGSRARWTNRGVRAPAPTRYAWSADPAHAERVGGGGCSATGASAVLCVGVK